MKIALLQLRPNKNLSENLKIGIAACKKAKEKGAELALFPEMWSNGYHVAKMVSEMNAEAISQDCEFVLAFSALAKELCMAIGITILERYNPSPRNTLILFDRFGRKALTYAKVHTCDFDVERNLTPGDGFFVTNLDTAHGIVKVGAMICFDREFPESARILMLQGAEIILVPNACPMEINRLEQLRSRAFENMVGIATCNYPEGVPDCNGHSSAFDGIAWFNDEPCSRDMCILKAPPCEGIYVADFDLDAMRKYRENEVFGNAFRHPKKYGLLVDGGIDEPFVRKACRR